MNDEQLDRALRSIGKECYVTFFGELCDLDLLNETVARYMSEDRGCDYEAALTRRVHPARKIIIAGSARDALIVCSRSRGLPLQIRD